MRHAYTLKIALIVSLGGFLFGFDASVISGVVGYVQAQFGLNELQTGWVVGSPTFAAMFAMLVAGTLSDYIGRRQVLRIAALLYSVSALLSALAPGYEVLVLARMIGGLAFGAALVIAPIYIAEISPEAARGRMVSVQQFNIVLGFSVSYFSNYLLLLALKEQLWALSEQNIWRWMLAIELLPALAYYFLLFAVPRSPRWLLMKGAQAEAIQTLTRMVSAAEITTMIQSMQHSLQERMATRGINLAALFDRRMRLVLTVGLIVGVVQQVTGVNAIYFYAPSIFEQSGVGTNAAFAQAVMVGFTNVVFTVVAILLIDKLGRKPLLMAGLAGVLLSMLITSYGFYHARYQLDEAAIAQLEDQVAPALLQPMAGYAYETDLAFKTALKAALGADAYRQHESALIQAAIQIDSGLVLLGILLFVASFAVSLGPVMWVLLSELFPNHIRGLAIAVVGFVNSSTSFLVQLFFPWELSHLGNALTFVLFGVFALLGLVLLQRLLPETKGMKLEEIEMKLAS